MNDDAGDEEPIKPEFVNRVESPLEDANNGMSSGEEEGMGPDDEGQKKHKKKRHRRKRSHHVKEKDFVLDGVAVDN